MSETNETYFTPIDIPALPEIYEGYLPDSAFVHFAFSRHGDEEDFDAIASIVSDSDIVIPEAVYWRPDHLKWFRDISRSTRQIIKSYLGIESAANKASKTMVTGAVSQKHCRVHERAFCSLTHRTIQG